MNNLSHKVMGSATAPASVRVADKFGVIGARLERESMQAAGSAIRGLGGSNVEMRASASLKNVLEGSVKIEASWFDPARGRVKASAEAPVAGGAVSFDAKAFVASAGPEKHESPTAAAKTYEVDTALLRAKRAGAMVALSHDALPEWGLHLSLDEIKASREGAEARISASIQGFCASMLGRNASFKGDVKIPIVASDVPAAPAPQPEVPKAVEHPDLAAEQARLDASAPSSRGQEQKADPAMGVTAAWEASEAVRGSLVRAAMGAAESFVRKSGGGSPSVKNVDLSGVTISASKVEGSAVVSVSFYGHRAMDEATIEVPFDAAGRVVASGVGRTKADLAAAEELRRRLEIASEAEARMIFEKFVAEQTAKQVRAEQLGININATSEMGYGGNWIKRGPADRIPIPKHALPEEFSAVGKKILLGGLVYELQPTDYNAPSIERSAHWMLELRMDIPASKADYAYGFGGLGESLAAAGL